ncbi:hypothetical protein SAMN04487948_103389 [Halogranum amylolyticum]|uniref:DUF2071 domain-containing protein n=1 Tax=Halogranum amylolyticum TaxID=660520 RepID=A0A1H8QYU6_9EURY|nr:DUF2071 domain-containing protein [Halogranum amylolyticum]SEO59177.1 hypothetical protein SAMN04487948_103389 [Halogranum amylolyticum]
MTPPVRPSVATMTAEDVVCLHWPVDPDLLRPRLPTPLDLSLFDETAWLSVVAFGATDLRPRGTPARLGRSFSELRLQTYVWHRGTPGRYVFSVDAGDRPIAHLFRLTSRIPYVAADGRVERDDDGVHVVSRRDQLGMPPATFEATVTLDGESSAVDGRDRDRWIGGHGRVFGAAGGTLWALDVERETPAFRPATATLWENTLFDAAGVPTPSSEPAVRYSPSWPMHASLPWLVRQ